MSLEVSASAAQAVNMDMNKGPVAPLAFFKEGENGIISRISGKEDVRKFLAGLGFVPGAMIRIVSFNSTGLIVDVKGSRIALDSTMASKIMCGLVG